MGAAVAVLERTGRCHGCGQPMKYLPISWMRQNKYYCSKECRADRPPLLAREMERRGIDDPRACVLAVLRPHASVDAAARSIGISHAALRDWIKRYEIRREVVWS